MASAKKRTIPFITVEKCSSTNSFVKENCTELPEMYTIRAIVQTHGRGRFDRKWLSSPEDDLTFSTLVPISETLQSRIIHIPQITALAVKKTLNSFGIEPQIKWPNDILVDSKKISGILVEGVFEKGKQYLVVGIGLNINSFHAEIAGTPAISMAEITGLRYDPDDVMKKITETLYELMEMLENEGFGRFTDELNQSLAYKNEWKSVIIDGIEHYLQICGVAEDGALVMKDGSGDLRTIISGEISFKC